MCLLSAYGRALSASNRNHEWVRLVSLKKDTLRKKLAVFIDEIEFSDLSDEAVQRAKFCLLDLIGVAIAGSQQPTSLLARESLDDGIPPTEATLWTSNLKLSVLSASFLNAVQAHAIDMDDGHRYANGHPGVVTIPAAVTLAERERLSGRELLTAVVIGYEVFIRLGRMVNPDLLSRGFHTTATIGPFAAAAVASKLLKLSVSQTENALSLAGLQSAGLLEALSSGEMGKSFQVGKAVQNGVLASVLARKGADGPERIFEGDKGFFKAFPGKECEPELFSKSCGRQSQITDVYFKKHAACRHVHSALDAAAEILSEHDIDRNEIQAIDVETYSIAKNLTGHLVTDGGGLAAKFSLPTALGLLLVFGRTDALAFTRENISDPQVKAIAGRVAVTVSSARDDVYPGKRGAEVKILAGGRTYQKEVIYPKGEPENPLSSEELFEKFETNAGIVYASGTVREIRERIMNAEQLDAGAITALLKEPGPAR